MILKNMKSASVRAFGGDSRAARKRFQQAVDTNVGSFMEYNTADAELRRVGLR